MTTTELREAAQSIVAKQRDRKTVIALAKAWLAQNPEPQPLPPLTMRQKEIYDFVRETAITRQTSPTVREIGSRFGISSPNGVMCHLKALTKKGVFLHEPHQSRGVRIADCYR